MNTNKKFAQEKENEQRNKLKKLTLFSEYIPVFPDDEYSRTDGYLINMFTDKRYDFESKWYGNINYQRNSDKFPNFQIDYDKLLALEQRSIEKDSTPLLICFFSNELVIWNINNCDWKKTKKSVYTNKIGGDYGRKKEYAYQAYLRLDDAIYRDKRITPFT
jgi:hypothetical protein